VKVCVALKHEKAVDCEEGEGAADRFCQLYRERNFQTVYGFYKPPPKSLGSTTMPHLVYNLMRQNLAKSALRQRVSSWEQETKCVVRCIVKCRVFD
jgi:hypothetical protein